MKTLSWAISLVLVGCATSGTGGGPAQQYAAETSSAAQERSQRDVEIVDELEISRFAEDSTVCRREAPLGSRIAVKRCYSTNETATDAALDQIQRDDFETMRQRQTMLEQQRAAREMAIRQRAMMPRQ